MVMWLVLNTVFSRQRRDWRTIEPNLHLMSSYKFVLPRRHIVMVAGYHDLTNQEFTENYIDELERTMARGDTFLLSDEPGACTMAFKYLHSLQSHSVDDSRIVVYISSDTGTATNINTSQIQAVAGGDSERYVAMAEDSSSAILGLRQGDWPKFKYQIEILDARFSGVKEAMGVVQTKKFRHMMWLYDQHV